MKMSEKLPALLAGAFILAGICLAVHVHQGYEKGRETYHNLESSYTLKMPEENTAVNDPFAYDKETETADQNLTEDIPGHIRIDWENLLADYENIVAWIRLPAVELSYPVMQAEDNDYYLHRAPDGGDLFAGSIFMDCQCSPLLQNYNTILYGHNMRDGSMFACLKQYNDPEVFASCPYFRISTPEGEYLYRIFSVHTAGTGESTYTIRFADQKAYMNWLKEMEDASEIDSGADVPSETRIVTLSTCTGDTSTRQVVQGYLIADCYTAN